MQTIIIVAIAAIVGAAALFVTKKPDSPVEQMAEAVIDKELGLPAGTVDFSKDNEEVEK